MSNLIKLEFVALQSWGKNYLLWVLDTEIYLDAMGLGDTIKNDNKASKQDCAKAMIFLRHHIDEFLKTEYLTVKDSLVLWNRLKERYDYLKKVIHPKARYDWIHLRLQDYTSIHEYNSAIFRIASQMKLYGDPISDVDMLEKTFSTFHALNVVLQQQYREKNFKKYSDLISHLLVAEQNNDLLMKNHEKRPIESASFPEMNEACAYHAGRGRGHYERGRGRGRGRNSDQRQNSFPGVNHSPKKIQHKNRKEKNEKGEVVKTKCFRYDGRNHYARDCRTPKHLVELYQASLKKKDKNSEANFIAENYAKFTHLDVADFFVDPEEKINYLIGDGSVNMEEYNNDT